MNSTSRSRVRVFSALFAVFAAVTSLAAGPPVARAATPRPRATPHAASRASVGPEYWFSGARLIFQHAQVRPGGELAVATDDLGLGRLLTKTGATIAYDPAQRTVVITTADRRAVSFTLDDPHFLIGDVGETAPFAPFRQNNVAYLPLSSLLLALEVASVESLNQTILQPQLAGIDVQTTSLATIVTLHAATPLRFKRISETDDARLTIALLGVGSKLPGDRPVSGNGLSDITINIGGTPRNPTTVLSFDANANGTYRLAPSKSPNDLVLAFAPEGTSLGGNAIPSAGDASLAVVPLAVRAARTNVPPAPPQPPPTRPTPLGTPDDDATPPVVAPIATAQPTLAPATAPPAGGGSAPAGGASLTSLDDTPEGLGLTVRVGLRGDAVPFEYHRLPDDRWYVDLRGVALAIPPRDESVASAAVSALRVKQLTVAGEPVTRIALTLNSPRIVRLVAAPGGFTIAVDALDDLAPKMVGQGTLGGGLVTAGSAFAPPAAAATAGGDVPPTLAEIPDGPMPWKFAPARAGGGRLIVIDPGHGGSDTGAAHNGLREADLTLDMSRRLKALLIARGWQVKMTRETDVDVFGVNASAHDELQARCDVANLAGAKLFVSIHVNSFTTPELNGTTTYYYTGASLPFAEAVHRRLMAAALNTKNDGVRRENFYVIHHTTMPAILVETAFVSNPSDADLLRSPAWRAKLAAGIAAGIGDYDAANPASAAFSKSDDAAGGQ